MKINVLIQISKNSKKKYVLDKGLKLPRLEIILTRKAPFDYGVIPHAHSVYGLGCMVLSEEASLPVSLLPAIVIGSLKIKYGDIVDDEIIAVPINSKIRDINSLSKQKLNNAVNFIKYLKFKETGKKVKLKSIKNREETEKIIKHSIELYKRVGK